MRHVKAGWGVVVMMALAALWNVESGWCMGSSPDKPPAGGPKPSMQNRPSGELEGSSQLGVHGNMTHEDAAQSPLNGSPITGEGRGAVGTDTSINAQGSSKGLSPSLDVEGALNTDATLGGDTSLNAGEPLGGSGGAEGSGSIDVDSSLQGDAP